jgi:hypothetical protein
MVDPRLLRRLGALVALAWVSGALAGAASASSSLRPQTVLNAIHQALHPGDHTQNHNCQIGGPNALPPKPCRHDRILPTSAFLTASRGGFTTACDNPYISTYRTYEISTLGQRFKTCGPLGVWPHKAHPGEFQATLDSIGGTIAAAAGVSIDQTATQIRGNRLIVRASYECPAVKAGASPSGVKEVRIGRSGKATIADC